MARYQKWLNNSSSKGAAEAQSCVCGLHNEVELLLNITLEHEVDKTQENAI